MQSMLYEAASQVMLMMFDSGDVNCACEGQAVCVTRATAPGATEGKKKWIR